MNVVTEANKMQQELIEVRRHLHQHPELSNQEFETAAFVAKKLRALGLEVEEGVGGTGVVGVLKGSSPGKTLGLRADMDALPINEATNLEFSSKNSDVMHACGHDFHTTVLLGAATLLSAHKEEVEGNIKFIFQPAEEKLIGASQMIDDNVLKNPNVDAMMALHCWPDLPAGTIGIKKGEVMASGDAISIKVKGKQGHAAHPHKSIDPIMIASYIVTKLQTIISREIAPVDSSVITIGTINGGTAFNIIPSTAELTGTVRVLNPEIRKRMPEMIKRIVEKTAESMNGEAELTYTYGPPPLVNTDNMIDLLDESITETIGSEQLVYMDTPSMGSEDFAFYLQKVPGLFFRLGTQNTSDQSKLPLHSPEVVFEEDALQTGVTVMSNTALKYLKSFK